LTFLCKPGKSGRTPAELRPIALLEPTGKAVMGLLAHRLFHSVSSRLLRLPQLAYLPLRGSDEAICRVRKHCSDVCDMLHLLRFDIHRAANDTPGPDAAGGLLLSLDLTKAFDSVLRSKLFHALESLGADSQTLDMLRHIYEHTSFSFWHRGQSRTLPTHRGIRQGCKAAPILWSCFAAWILETAAATNGWAWLHEALTAYADDFCLHSIFRSVADFHLTISKVGTFLDLLLDAGLSINRDKTIAILKLHGPFRAKLYKRYVKRTKDGTFICIPSRHGNPFMIRLVSQVSYLGVVLCYSNFELLTMKHRIQAGVKISHQLQRWIFSTTGLSQSQKIKLWFQCIFPCLTYGIRPIGLTSQTVQMLDRAFLQQLRRICRSPVHLTHLTHVDFLERAGIADPLLSYLHQCRKAQRRESQRVSKLQADDIVHFCPATDYDQLEQVLLQAYALRRDSETLHQAEFVSHACPQCELQFSTMAQLRRHQTLEHGHRPGLLRPYTAMESHAGLPTCQRCGKMFTTWHRLHYHAQFVCTHALQEDEDLEHRLRVREYLHYVQGVSFVALCQRQDLTTYFTHRCILCGKYLTTSRGVLRHWSDAHNDVFRQHGDWNAYLLHQVGTSNPCEFCGTHFQREQNCVVIRQYAMYMTAHGQQAPAANHRAPTAFPCTTCDKVFLTKHGLEQHLRNFHSAIQVGDQLSDAQIDAHCLVMQAVETDACMDLLGHPHIAELLSHVCLTCQKPFQRKNELVRHLKGHHASLWNQIVIDATIIEERLKGPQECFCIPPVYNRKHQCMLTLQFALLRLTAQPGPDAELARSSTPDLLLAPAEIVHQLAWLGLLRLLTHNPALKMTLSLHCQVCGSNFTSPTQLMGHLRALHGQAISEAAAWIRLLTWVLFSAHGCLCNPAVNHGTPLHTCPLIYNLALMINDGATDIIIPWHYRATDLMDVLEPLVTEPVLSKVTTLMMTRRFEDVMMSTEVYQLLTQRCLLCDTVIPLSCARTHIRVAHNFDLRCLEAIIQQLATRAAQTHFDHWCSFCGQLLPYDLEDEDFTPRPEQHMLECDYIALVAMLLSYPVWYKKPFIPDEWPTIDEVERGSHEVHLQLMQFNAQPSAQVDALGQSFEQLAACGFFMMSDPKFLDQLHFHCLMCGRKFYTPWKMFEHLQTHNYRQYDTFLCSRRLHLRCQQPCQFCSLQRHLAQLGSHCLPLFHLAVFLCNGGGLGPGQRYLEFNSVGRTNESVGPWLRQQQTGQKAKDREQGGGQERPQALQTVIRRIGDHGCQTGIEDGGQFAAAASRTSVHSPSTTGTRFGDSPDVGGDAILAQRLQGNATEASFGGGPDFHPGGATDPSLQVNSKGSSMGRVPEAESDRFGRQYAVSQMGCNGPDIEADEGCNSEAGRSPSCNSEHPSVGPRSDHDHPIPWTDKAFRVNRPGNPISMDDFESQSAGSLERSQASLLSRHLAVSEDLHQATGHREEQSVQGHSAEVNQRIVRIMMNPGNICFANALVICLAWATLTAGTLDPQWWPLGGFELFRSVTAISGIPLNLLTFQPFLWLLTDGWTITDMDRQQDVAEFAHWFLQRTKTLFVNCAWVARFMRGGMENDPSVSHEKGHPHGLIQLPIFDAHAPTCSLQNLIDSWHDDLGLCRSATQVGRTIVLSISRFLPDTTQKCAQKIVFSNTVKFPSFIDGSSDVHHFQYLISGFIFHLGQTPYSGHYQAAIRCRNKWFLYEDGQLPEQCIDLPDHILQNTVLFWLHPLDGIAARDIEELRESRERNIAEEDTAM